MGMQEDINGNSMCHVMSAVENTFSEIIQSIQEREERIQNLQHQLGNMENQVSQLYYLIALA